MAAQDSSGDGALSRRGFIGWALGIGAALVAIVAGVPQVAALIAIPARAKPQGFVDVAKVSDLPAGKPTALGFTSETADAYNMTLLPHNVWAVKTSDTAVAVFSPVCTHLGCQVGWDPASQRFVCPCHNSIFTQDGAVVSGPAPRALDQLPSKVKDGVLSVQWVDYTPGIPAKQAM
jgi:menaquinol-cytochrome c reductase iron-sulfur subunit